jgi:hypothetical protein
MTLSLTWKRIDWRSKESSFSWTTWLTLNSRRGLAAVELSTVMLHRYGYEHNHDSHWTATSFRLCCLTPLHHLGMSCNSDTGLLFVKHVCR